MEDVEDDRQRFLKKEAMQRDSLLQTTTQLNTLRSVYENEIALLRPLLYEQLEHVKEDRKQMVNLRTDVTLSVDRFSITESHMSALDKELREANKEKMRLEVRLKSFDDRYASLLKENGRLDRLSKVTLAAKLHGDDVVRDMTEKLRVKTEELSSATDQIRCKNLEIAKLKETLTSTICQLDAKTAEAEKFHMKSQAGVAEVAAQELVIDQLKDQLSNLVASGCTPEKQEELESKDRVIHELQELLRKLKKQLKMSLTRVYELQEEVDQLRLNSKMGDVKQHGTLPVPEGILENDI